MLSAGLRRAAACSQRNVWRRWSALRGAGARGSDKKRDLTGDPEAHAKVAGWEKRYGGTHGFPDFIEAWDEAAFKRVGAGMGVVSVAALYHLGLNSWTAWAMLAGTGAYFWVGFADLKQDRHAVRKNFPVLGNLRYFFEVLRPEIYQYFIEADGEGVPFSRENRSVVYQRAKDMVDTLPMGTRRDVYSEGYEWAQHSLFPKVVPDDRARVLVGGPDCKQPYSASLLNISAMSFGALSKNAVLALNKGAAMGGFYHNTGEGGVSRYHLQPGGDIVWNVGTAYNGCRHDDGTFNPKMFQENATKPNIKMIELKLSQGAKPAHGGLLPGSKLTPAIAEARGIDLATWGNKDVHSPANHSAFDSAEGMMHFIAQLRELSGGKPVGIKLCIGNEVEAAMLVHAMLDTGITPDFITIDGGEGGTGAAPPEFSNHVGTPLVDAVTLMNGLLRGAGLRDRVKIIASGKVLSGFSIVRNLALGADICNSARAMMFAIGCIQALKCNTNHCPSGVATQDERLMAGLVPDDKAHRVANFHSRTVDNALEIVGSLGLEDPSRVRPWHIMRRSEGLDSHSYAEIYPKVPLNALINGDAVENRVIQRAWTLAKHDLGRK